MTNTRITYRAAVVFLWLALLSVSAAGQGRAGKALGLHTVVIDPGHGGKDPGCVSADGKTYEKTLVLKISEGLKKRIAEAYTDVSVYLTRNSNDVFVPLNDRAKFATAKGADLFISVHINATKSKSINGFSAWILGQSSKSNSDTYAFNMEICQRENEVVLLEDDYTTRYEGFDPSDPESDIFLHLMNSAYRGQSLIFAQMVDEKMKDKGPFRSSLGVRQQNFAVLRLATMPAVLLEMGFISNSGDLTELRDSEKLEKMIDHIFEAFRDYKNYYDESVGAKSQSAVFYGTQVLATEKTMGGTDAFFLGYEARSIQAGKIIKYFIGCSDNLDEARKLNSEIKRKYPDSFLVKIENEVCTRVR